jgi:uncharacterized NAD(P)/FAD-binding protein YdhS
MVLSRLVAVGHKDIEIDIFEASSEAGSGMPYSQRGALAEHITNVSADELPRMRESLDAWVLGLPEETLKEFSIKREEFHEKKVVPRLLFGRYLNAQFEEQQNLANTKGMKVQLHLRTKVARAIICETLG